MVLDFVTPPVDVLYSRSRSVCPHNTAQLPDVATAEVVPTNCLQIRATAGGLVRFLPNDCISRRRGSTEGDLNRMRIDSTAV
ncbi:hypothetical protein NPIL_617541 [Nephila pilipes]|uniref:Uncharacterized protein n=1 Tax=Nephila pilipes TaxID=299642 RepID=A0A8X6TQA3_NEPPI|nr:hypothetical protein NPIL_517791 [Nephila pilipes]GFT35231.1 hypothetical protein NPIL_84691 [Nephila pilipes]GFT72724.1 hypothetical protein NPIL_278751 [Nephila pilipes]GFT91117.1 hypothetical protein NPIL_617541 [Nephila pilipes]